MVEKEIVLFRASENPVKIIISGSEAIFKDKGRVFRIILLPQGEKVIVYDVFGKDRKIEIKQKPPVNIKIGPNRFISDKNLLGINCWFNPETQEKNPPELTELIKFAQELGYQLQLSPIAFGLIGLSVYKN